ncbi:hypothetical protein FJT64_027559 [Amphibalanus amphitrite]|uniref:Uncharacterized protein n=1 Tax=Amphibalanus amphitrite TaxID=1232801 RepID=A0A6A4WCZ5_AMPAM|nr:hypothetical protein FJT64_027559 [Amphibalanus amphitrite]
MVPLRGRWFPCEADSAPGRPLVPLADPSSPSYGQTLPPLLPLTMLYPGCLLHAYPHYQRWYSSDAKAPLLPPSAPYSEMARQLEAVRLWGSLARREMTSPANNGEPGARKWRTLHFLEHWDIDAYRDVI